VRGARLRAAVQDSAEALRTQLDAQHATTRRDRKRLLLVQVEGASGPLSDVVCGDDVEITPAHTPARAIDLLGEHRFDCVLLDASSAAGRVADVLRQAAGLRGILDTPFVVYAPGSAAAVESRRCIVELAGKVTAVIAPSLECALAETTLFLHRAARDLSADQMRLLDRAREVDVLAGRTVLIVDDDARNIFALSSLLERYDVRVLSSTSGADALRMIGGIDDLSLVLLDIMMPEMDGYETMRRMRAEARVKQPIIALTAKAMAGDRQKCLEAGASDYIAKPVDGAQFLSLLRVWLHR
jgi:CheY-like chemotaxis protein